MIVPSIDLMGGQTVQLIGGEKKAIEAGDPLPIAEKFGRVGEIAVIDLDAALGQGNNESLVKSLLGVASCRVGGGIRDAGRALHLLDLGARRVILGTAAKPEILTELPADRVVAALDCRHGEVVVEGWQKQTGTNVYERMHALRPFVDAFMVTFVEREGRLQGIDLTEIKRLKEAAQGAQLTVAGGVTTLEEVRAIDALGVHAQVGMALYTGRFTLGDAIAAMLNSDRADGLWPTVVVDEHQVALGLVYSSAASLNAALESGRGVYYSRSRRSLWFKGEQSGATQALLGVSMDCDRDALRFTVRQAPPGFCHEKTHTCFGDDRGVPALARMVRQRCQKAPGGSYTKRLLEDPALLASKLVEEAGELAEAATPTDVAHEAADVLYFTLVALARGGATWDDVAKVLEARRLKVSRRPGNAKPPRSKE